MKKIIAFNGSPRRDRNTATLLKYALDGAKSVGAETELIHLADLNFRGCVSCFLCKLKKNNHPGMCFYKDDLTPILEKIVESDAIVLGSPIFVGEVTGMMRNLMERLFFMAITYDNTPTRSEFKGSVNAGFIYTMNVPKDNSDLYKHIYELNDFFAKRLNGKIVEHYISADTYQFKDCADYANYNASMFDEKQKAQILKNQFPIDCNNAFELGKRLVK
ncbi:MAG: flavodoxin family protein [Elusimicrobiota bacterium]|jgi:multimeric flavodoxin WrbA|nr:flavodoxin family protein [Elusimicrobiota bacterium]